MQNITGSAVDGDNFHGREHELGVLRRLVEPDAYNDVLLLSPRRVGKSSLALETIRRLREDGWICIYCDVEHAIDEGHFLEEFRLLVDHPKLSKKLSKQVAEAVGGFRRTMSGMTMKGAGFEVAVTEPEEVVDWKTASDAVEQLLKALAEFKQPVFLVVDELPIFLSKLIRQQRSETAIDVLNWLRKVRGTTREGFAWLFAGSVGLDSQVEYLGVSGTISDLKIERLGPMSVAETKEMIYRLAASVERPIDIGDVVVERIIERVGWLIPSYVQLIYHALAELRPDRRSSAYPSPEDVDTAYAELMDAHYASKFEPWDGRLDEPFISPEEAARARFVLGRICRHPQGIPYDTLLQELLAKTPNAEEEELRRSLLRVSLLLERDGYLAKDEIGTVAFRSPLLRDYWNRRR